MERRTEFNLTTAIREWRNNLKCSASFENQDLDELESHLLDEIDQLRALSLSEREAFMIAADRIGSTEDLEAGYISSKSQWSIFRSRAGLYLNSIFILMLIIFIDRISRFLSASIMHYFVLPLKSASYVYLGTFLATVIISFFVLRYFHGKSLKPQSRLSFTGYLTITFIFFSLLAVYAVVHITQFQLPSEYFTVLITSQALSLIGFCTLIVVSIIYSIKDFRSYKLRTS
jgi:hypothetical protein